MTAWGAASDSKDVGLANFDLRWLCWLSIYHDRFTCVCVCDCIVQFYLQMYSMFIYRINDTWFLIPDSIYKILPLESYVSTSLTIFSLCRIHRIQNQFITYLTSVQLKDYIHCIKRQHTPCTSNFNEWCTIKLASEDTCVCIFFCFNKCKSTVYFGLVSLSIGLLKKK